MNIVDIIAIVIILIGALSGLKKKTIKSLIQLITLVATAIVAYQLTPLLGNFVIRKLPFFNFAGYADLYTLNIMFYRGVSFVLLFVILYCVLNILLDLSGIVEWLVGKILLIELPDRIIGAILSAVETLFFVFIIGFVMLQNPFTQKFVMDSSFVKTTVEKTPVVAKMFALTTVSAEKIYDILDAREEKYDPLDINMKVATVIIQYSDSTDLINELIKNGKMHMDNVVFASQKVK